MPIFPDNLKAVVFDYGNTLIPFGRAEVDEFDQVLGSAIVSLYGPMDQDRYKAHRNADRLAPYVGDPPEYRESDPLEMTAALIRDLYAVEPSAAELDSLLRIRREAFVDVVRVDPEVAAFLQRLRARYAVGLLSNYPDGVAIRNSLENIGLSSCFDSVVVSGDVGLVKPHPYTFSLSMDELDVKPEQTLFVGDNWLADVQGAKRAGMSVAHFTRWTPPEHFERQQDDFEPDLSIDHLVKLIPFLGFAAVA